MKNVVFFGSDAIALPVLDALQQETVPGVRLAGIVSGPDRKVGRGRKLQPNPVAGWARSMEVHLLQPDRPDAAVCNWLECLSADLIVVMAYGHILPESLLRVPTLGCWNLHASLLPAYRGASPIESALALGERVTGVSLMRMVKAMDAGPVHSVERVTIGTDDSGPDLREKIATASAALVKKSLGQLLLDPVITTEQDHSKASYVRKLGQQDRQLDFTAAASVLAARIRAFSGWPGSTVPVGEVTVKLEAPSVVASAAGQQPAAGTVLGLMEGGLGIQTGDGILQVGQLQRPGGRLLPAEEFVRGFPLAEGTILPSLPMEPLLVVRKSAG